MNLPKKRELNIPLIEQYYDIKEDGAIWSKRKQKYLKPTFNTAGYLYVMLCLPYANSPESRMYGVHRIMACKYIGQCPDGMETSHKDGNKCNNHYTNFEYLTHSQNILKSFREHGRSRECFYYPHKPFSDHAKELMSNAKKKKVRFVFDGMEAIFDSINDACQSLNSYRKKIQRCIYTQTPFTDRKQPDFTGILSFYNL